MFEGVCVDNTEEIVGMGFRTVDGGSTTWDEVAEVGTLGGILSSSSILDFEAGSGTRISVEQVRWYILNYHKVL